LIAANIAKLPELLRKP
jgi:hypothetical protein